MASINLSKEWIAFVASLSDAPKNLLKSIFTALLSQLTVLSLQLNINSLRYAIQIQIQTILIGIAQGALNTAKATVTPVTDIFNALPKGKTSEKIPIPTSIPEINTNMQSLFNVMNKPQLALDVEKDKLNKLKLYAASADAKKNQLADQMALLMQQINNL